MTRLDSMMARAWLSVAVWLVGSGAGSATAGDLILTGAKPDHLFVIDARTRTVRSDFRIQGAEGIVGVIVTSSDQKIAYVLVDRMERVVGIDLSSGRQVFRADLSSPRSGSSASFRSRSRPTAANSWCMNCRPG